MASDSIDYSQVRMPPLTEEERRVLLEKGTESPFSGKYWNTKDQGIYSCRVCGTRLYRSDDKFDAGCGWPSFDDEISGAVARQPDRDGMRTEIVCARCGSHLGHIFTGERQTPKNLRHCVNSASLYFTPTPPEQNGKQKKDTPLEEKETSATAVFGGGCFWGVEHAFRTVPGVLDAVSGYTGGHLCQPDYRQVCTGDTGHAEAVKVSFAPEQVSYEELARFFFEIHDPTQVNRQGPDVGSQYRSVIFYADQLQKDIAEKLTDELRFLGYDVATRIEPLGKFYPAENYHQRFIEQHSGVSCAVKRVSRFHR